MYCVVDQMSGDVKRAASDEEYGAGANSALSTEDEYDGMVSTGLKAEEAAYGVGTTASCVVARELSSYDGAYAAAARPTTPARAMIDCILMGIKGGCFAVNERLIRKDKSDIAKKERESSC